MAAFDMEYYSRAARNPAHAQWLSPLLLGAEACLCAFIILKVPCMSRQHCLYETSFTPDNKS